MMKKILYILVAAILTVGCQNDKTPAHESGVAIAIKLNKTYSSETKAPINDDFQMETKHFAGKITLDGKTIYQWDDLTKMPAVVKLEPADDYIFEIQTGGLRTEINEVPMYRGNTKFAVKEYQLTSVLAEVKIDCMAASVALEGGLVNVTGYKLSFFNLENPTQILHTIEQAQNTPKAKKVYFDKPFSFGVKIDGRYNGSKWSKSIVQYENIDNNVLHSIIVK